MSRERLAAVPQDDRAKGHILPGIACTAYGILPACVMCTRAPQRTAVTVPHLPCAPLLLQSGVGLGTGVCAWRVEAAPLLLLPPLRKLKQCMKPSHLRRRAARNAAQQFKGFERELYHLPRLPASRESATSPPLTASRPFDTLDYPLLSLVFLVFLQSSSCPAGTCVGRGPAAWC